MLLPSLFVGAVSIPHVFGYLQARAVWKPHLRLSNFGFRLSHLFPYDYQP